MFRPWKISLATLAWALCGPALSTAAEAAEPLDFSQGTISLAPDAPPLEELAARELQRYLYLQSGVKLPIGPANQPTLLPSIAVGTPTSHPLLAALVKDGQLRVDEAALGPEGFVLKSLVRDGQPVLAIAGTQPVGALYGVYTLLERLGWGFYLGGDAWPEEPGGKGKLWLPGDLDETHRPALAIRGSLPWYNFLNSPTTWDLEDHQFFYDQMAKMKMNFVGYHTYDSEPFVTYVEDGQHRYGAPVVTSANYGWGTVRGMKTAEFGFGTGDYFDQEEFGSRATTEAKDPNDAIRRAQALLQEAFAYARSRGIKVCLGFELTGDPTDPEARRRLELRLRALVQTYPMLDYVWLWQSEGLGGGADLPPPDSPLDVLRRKQHDVFAYLGNEGRIAEAVRMSYYVQLAHHLLKRFAPEKRLIISGWGGDRWMRFSDFYLGFDQTLPKDIIFAALDNIDPTAEPNVSHVYGELSPERERWPIPWWESDGGGTRRDQWGPQCNVAPFVHLCRDALRKGCQGMLAIHWRTRGVEEVAAYQAQFAWNPDLTYEQFYDGFARRCFGPTHAAEMSAILRQLEALGPHWTGSLGQVECGGFDWFTDPRRPQPGNLRTLAAIRARLIRILHELHGGSEAKTEPQTLTTNRQPLLAQRASGLGTAGERLARLVATIDWLTAYDRAAVEFTEGNVPKWLAEAETLKQQGEAAASAARAAEAWEGIKASGFREAMEALPRLLVTQSDWGVLATVNVKAYAMYERLEARLRNLLPLMPPRHVQATSDGQAITLRWEPVAGAAGYFVYRRGPGEETYRRRTEAAIGETEYADRFPAGAKWPLGPYEYVVTAVDGKGQASPASYPATAFLGPDTTTPTVTMKLPSTGYWEGEPIGLWAAVQDDREVASVTLHYRALGEGAYQAIPMGNPFRHIYRGTIPGEAVTPAGIEFYVEARDAAGNVAYAPAGYPRSVFSATVLPAAGPLIFPPRELDPPRPGHDWPLETVILGRGAPVAEAWLTMRRPDGREEQRAALANPFYHTFHQDIPGGLVLDEGTEYALEAADAAGRRSLFPADGLRRLEPDRTPPEAVTDLRAEVAEPYEVTVSWAAARDDQTVAGYVLHRGETPDFELTEENRRTTLLQPPFYDLEVRPEGHYTYAVAAVDAAGNVGPFARATVAVPRVPAPPPPADFQVTAGRGRAKLTWKVAERPVVGYRVYRLAGKGEPEWLNREGLIRVGQFLDAGLDPNVRYTYRVAAVDRGGVEGQAAEVRNVQPLPPTMEPVFTASFDGEAKSAQGLAGRLVAPAGYAEGIIGQALDVRQGGYAVFPDHDDLDLSGDLTVAFWMKLDKIGQIPVLLAHGHWLRHGYFVQVFGNRNVRWFVGQGAVLDAGRVELGVWTHVACTYDLHTLRLYLNGQEVGQQEVGQVDLSPWDAPLYVGQYTDLGPEFQTFGLLDEVKIYQRALSATEVRAIWATETQRHEGKSGG